MSYNQAHQNGRHGNHGPSNLASRNSTAPPRSTLANLLSSQRRSAAQSDRYRVQRARPFSDSARAATAEAARNADTTYSQSSQVKGYDKGSASSFSDPSRTTEPHSLGTKCDGPTLRSGNELDATTTSRRVRFSSSSDSKTTNTSERPRKRSRWDVRPRFAPAPSAQPKLSQDGESTSAGASIRNQDQDGAVASETLTKTSAGDIPKTKSILRKIDRSDGKNTDLQQSSIPKTSKEWDPTSKIRDATPTEKNSSVNAYERTLDEPKSPHLEDSAADKSHVPGGNSELHNKKSRWDDMRLETVPKESLILRDTPEINANSIMQSEGGGNILKDKIEPEESGDKMQATGDVRMHITSAEENRKTMRQHIAVVEKGGKVVDGGVSVDPPKPKDECPQYGKLLDKDLPPIQAIRVTDDDTSRLKIDSKTRSKQDKKKRKERRSRKWDTMQRSSPKQEQDNSASPESHTIKPSCEKSAEQALAPKPEGTGVTEDASGLKQAYFHDDGSENVKLMQKSPPKPEGKDPAPPESNIEKESEKVMKADPLQKRANAVPNDNTSASKHDCPDRPKADGRGDAKPNKSIPLKISSKPKQEDVPQSPSSPPKKKRKKDFSPFRVKVGCVVAVKFRKLAQGGNPNVVSVVREGDSFHTIEHSLQSNATSTKLDDEGGNEEAPDGNSCNVDETDANVKPLAKDKKGTKRKSNLCEIWSAPIPGHDDGMALLGSWIRCIFSKALLAKWQKKSENGSIRSPVRTLEGNVVSVLANNGSSEGGINVCLLVDRSSIKSLPYLQVLSEDSNDSTISSSEQRRRKLEAKIRGENKVVVKVSLASVFDQRSGLKLDPEYVSQWVVRKRISARPVGKIPTKKERKINKQHAQSLFVGDSNDSQDQQELNWRWIASHTACQNIDSSGHSALGNNVQDPFSDLVGEVIGMDTSPAQDGPTTLATVTIKRLWSPEQMQGGRLVQHRPLELFDSGHDYINQIYIQAPIEDLIVIGKGINRHVDHWKQPSLVGIPGGDPGWNFIVTHSYQPSDHTCKPLCEDAIPNESLKTCHCCKRLQHDSQLQKCQHGDDLGEPWWCLQCLNSIGVSFSCNDIEPWEGPCCTGDCECLLCSSNACKLSSEHSASLQSTIDTTLSDLVASLQTSSPMGFTLPNQVGQLSLRPSFLPITGNVRSKSYSKTKDTDETKPGKIRGKHKKKQALADCFELTPKVDSVTSEEKKVFKFGSSRMVPFDELEKSCWGASKQKLAKDDSKEPFFRQNASPRVIKIGKTEETTSLTGRAARANQRRMMKSLASLGDSSTTVDRLAGRDREQHLRFDKSQIHGWGVYAEESINAGDMIIEYRGEIIGNAVADKRELEYHREKLDDYMFRIDAYTVCDATMLGNVARYINSSCSPNCYTQIITAGENKRIVIYAKKDIQRGEELSYDYKFALEYDPEKRIPCHCGSLECRGFMNWDKKYL